MNYRFYAIALSFAVVFTLSNLRGDDVVGAFPDPGLKDPRLRFHLGQVVNNQPEISTIYPDMPFPVSDWVVTQWSQSSYMQGDLMSKDDPRSRDSRLGLATYGFITPDEHSHLWIYPDKAASSWIYEIYEQDGILKPGGGSNIFLSAHLKGKMTFDHEINYSVDLKLSQAEINCLTPTAKASGAVLGQVFSGFGINFLNPTTHEHQFVFLQIPVSNSRSTSYKGNYIFLPTKGQRPNLLYSAALLSGETTLPFAPDSGPLHSCRYLLNRYIAQVIARPYKWNGQMVDWPPEAHDFHNWWLAGMYIGLETQATDLRPKSTNHDKQGSVKVALQIANLSVTRDNNRVFDPATLSPPSP